MFNETEIEKRVGIKEFVDFVKMYNKKQIECTIHTFSD